MFQPTKDLPREIGRNLPAKAVKTALRSVEISNGLSRGLIKNLSDSYTAFTKGLLHLRYFYHRKLFGHKYLPSNEVDAVLPEYLARIKRAGGASMPQDVLLVSHEMSLTGAPRALFNLAIALKELGYRPAILSVSDGRLTQEANARDIPVLIDPYFFSGLKATLQVRCRFLDTFHAVIFNTIVPVYLSGVFSPVKSHKIGWIHESDQFFDIFPELKNIGSSLEILDEVWAVSEYCRKVNLMRTGYEGAIDVLPYGFNPEQTAPVSDAGEDESTNRPARLNFFIGGAITHNKGADVVAEALRRLPSNKLDLIRIIVAGDLTDSSITARLQSFGKECVELLGQIPHDQVLRLMKEADLILSPSIDESLSMVCAEGLWLSKPVILTDHNGIADLLDNGREGIILPAGDAGTLAGCIERCIDSGYDLESIGEAGHEVFLRIFTPDTFLRNVSAKFPPLSKVGQ